MLHQFERPSVKWRWREHKVSIVLVEQVIQSCSWIQEESAVAIAGPGFTDIAVSVKGKRRIKVVDVLFKAERATFSEDSAHIDDR